MAYNANTRLLLKFDGSSSTPGDTSQHAHSVNYDGTTTLVSGAGPFGDRAIRFHDQVLSQLIAENILQTGTGAACTLDLWVKIDTLPPLNDGSHVGYLDVAYDPVEEISAGVGIQVRNYGGAPYINFDCYTTAYGGVSHSEAVAINTWHHVRARVETSGFIIGLNGAQVISSSEPVFSASQVRGVLVAGGLIDGTLVDCIQVLQGDNSWTGGSYTVPTAPPDDYGTSSNPDLFGTCSNTLEQTTSFATAITEWLGRGELNVVSQSSTGTAGAQVTGTGQNTLSSITSKTPAPQLAYNDKTKLLVKFNDPLSYDSGSGQQYSKDTSQAARRVFLSLPNGLEHVGDNGVALSPSMRFGVPYGTYSTGRMLVESPGGIFSTSNTTLKRFDLWFSVENSTYALGPLFAVVFQNSDFFYVERSFTGVTIYITKGGVSRQYSAAINPYAFTHSLRHLRILLSSDSITVSSGGQQVYFMGPSEGLDQIPPWPGNSGNAISEVMFGDVPSVVPFNINRGFRGCLDAIEWLEGDTSYTGGNYALFDQESGDYDPNSLSALYGSGSNTTAEITSTGNGLAVVGAAGVGQNTVSVMNTGAGVVDNNGNASNTLEEILSVGRLEFGQWWSASGENTLDEIQATGDGVIIPVRFGVGQGTLDALTATAEGFISDRIGTGQGTLDTISVEAVGTTATPPNAGLGANTVTAVSTGAGTVAVSGDGQSAVDVTSSAAGLVAFNGLSQVLVDVFSSGAGAVLAAGTGANTVSVSSAGVANMETFGEGAGTVSVGSSGVGSAICSGIGSVTLGDVSTYFPAGYFDGYRYMSIKTARNEHWVKQ